MDIKKIHRDIKDEPKYKMEFIEIFIFIIILSGFIIIFFIHKENIDFKKNNNKINILEKQKNNLNYIILKN